MWPSKNTFSYRSGSIYYYRTTKINNIIATTTFRNARITYTWIAITSKIMLS
jgi:hypothetical protein